MATFLIGGGWDAHACPLVYQPFLAAAGKAPAVACVVLDEGDGLAQADRWAQALLSVSSCRPLPVLVPLGDVLDVAAFDDADSVLVCGGLTPAYAAALAPSAHAIGEWLRQGSRPFAGFSAGAAVAARDALVGGWRIDGMPVCPEDAAEDLDEVTVVAGLGVVPFTVDVHAAQWGTINRLLSAVRSGLVPSGLAIDENTMISVEEGTASVAGLGMVHRVTAGEDGVQIRSWAAGDEIDVTTWAEGPDSV